MPNLGVFRLTFFRKNYYHIFEINTLKNEFVKNEFSTNTLISGVGSIFSNDPGSAFSEGPSPGSGPGLGPLSKVCRFF